MPGLSELVGIMLPQATKRGMREGKEKRGVVVPLQEHSIVVSIL